MTLLLNIIGLLYGVGALSTSWGALNGHTGAVVGGIASMGLSMLLLV